MPVEGHTTRRAALGALASALVDPNVGTMPSSVDRIFAAIERHKAAWAAVGAMTPAVDEVAAIREGREITQADWEAFEGANAQRVADYSPNDRRWNARGDSIPCWLRRLSLA